MNACCPSTFPLPFGPVAQRLEQGTHNPLVGGSIPPGPISTNARKSRISSGLRAFVRFLSGPINPPQMVCFGLIYASSAQQIRTSHPIATASKFES